MNSLSYSHSRGGAKPHEYARYSAGKWYLSQLYIVGWSDIDAIKVGITSNGRARYGKFLSRGAELLELQTFRTSGDLEAEIFIQAEIGNRWNERFQSRDEAVHYLGGRGEGWTECYHVPVGEWEEVLDILRSFNERDQ